MNDAFSHPLPGSGMESGRQHPPAKKKWPARLPVILSAHTWDDNSQRSQAELFYLQKQIQMQTPMAIVLEDGEMIEGCIEWYDRLALKLRGRTRTLIYKSAIKYMYKQDDAQP